jgi:hypothetical protein
VREKFCYLSVLASGILLMALVFPRLGWAQYLDDVGGSQSGTTSMAPISAETPSGYQNGRRIVPGPPVQPVAVSRPESWPGGSAQNSSVVEQYRQSSPRSSGTGEYSNWPRVSAEAPKELYEDTTILARVGSEAIFAYEITAGLDDILARYKDKVPPSQLEAQRTLMIKQRLKSRIESKLIYQDAKRTIPAEGMTNVEKQISKYFESSELPNMLKRGGVETIKELDEKLRGMGTSLEREKRAYIERSLAQQWLRQQIKHDEEITYDQMLKYYKEHQAEFEKPARARWEELLVRFSQYSSKPEAYKAIARLGNQVLAGVPLAEAAKNGSPGAAAEGETHDWTTQGSLVCEELDEAIFGLPVGALSRIIESKIGYHIVRVVERAQSEVTPFLAAQVEIKEKILAERTAKQLEEYLTRLEDKTPIWTIYDGDQRNLRLAERFKDLPR